MLPKLGSRPLPPLKGPGRQPSRNHRGLREERGGRTESGQDDGGEGQRIGRSDSGGGASGVGRRGQGGGGRRERRV